MKMLAVIIAGGGSQRFNEGQRDGFDKFLAPFGRTTLLGHIIRRAQQQISPLLLNINGDPSRVQSFDIETFADMVPDQGPLGGLLTAMKLAQQKGFDHIITFSADTPFFPDDYVSRLVQVMADSPARIAFSCSGGRSHPVMGLFEITLQDDLQDYLSRGERRVLPWIMGHSPEKVVWPEINPEINPEIDPEIDPDPFFNINTPDDLAQAEKFL